MIRKLCGIVFFFIASCATYIVIYIRQSMSNSVDNDIFEGVTLSYFGGFTVYYKYIENCFFLLAVSIIIFLLCAGIKLFFKNKKTKIIKVLLLLAAVSLFSSGFYYYLYADTFEKKEKAFKYASADTVVQYISEITLISDRTNIRAKTEKNYVKEYKDEIIKRIKSNPEDKNALTLSLINGKIQTATLIKDIDKRDSDGRTPLMIALALSSDIETIKLLLAEEKDMFQRYTDKSFGEGRKKEREQASPDIEGRNALMYAAIFAENGEIIDLLISHRKEDIRQWDKDRNRSIHFAAMHNKNASVVERLIENGEKINLSNNAGETPLILAAKYDNIPAVKVLLKYKANLEIKKDNSCTALCYAALNKNEEPVKMLLDAGAKTEAKNFSAMKCAITGGSTKIVEMLFDAGYDFKNEKERKGIHIEKTNLFTAAIDSDEEMISLLLEKGMDINEKNDMGMGVLEVATINGDALNIVKFLQFKGVQPGKVSGEAFPLFVLASALNAEEDIIKAFINEGLDLKEMSSNGYDAFAAACRFNRNPKCIEVFLNNGLNFDDTDANGKTYLEHLKGNLFEDVSKHFADRINPEI